MESNMIVSESPRIELIHGDCMPSLEAMTENQYDLAIVDPPYGIEVNKMQLGSGKYKTKKEWDAKPPDKEYFQQLARACSNWILWGANHYNSLFMDFIPGIIGSPCWIVWDKKNGTSDFADCELAYTTFKTPVRKVVLSLSKGRSDDPHERFHPTEKPTYLYRWLLKNYGYNKDGSKRTILDTHGGSMSIAIACYDMGFDLTLYELDEDYYNAGVDRFLKHKQQLKLF